MNPVELLRLHVAVVVLVRGLVNLSAVLCMTWHRHTFLQWCLKMLWG